MPSLPTIERPHLIELLSDSSARIVKVIAPAGYGKSVLVNAWLAGREGAVARVDFDRIASSLEAARQFVTALGAFQADAIRTDLPDRILGLADDEEAWLALARDFALSAPPRLTLHLENCESLAALPQIQRCVERLVADLPSDARIVVCSRVDVFDFGTARPGDEARVITARDLMLTSAEIAEVFATLAVTPAQMRAIERFTHGWPIVVMMLFALARRGRLRAYLDEPGDVGDLYGYLATEVLSSLPSTQMRLVEAIAAIPDVTEIELSLLFPDVDLRAESAALRADAPFVVWGEAAIDVHPALREMLTTRIDIDAYRATLFERVTRDDGGVRAAELAMLRNRPIDAARVLAECSIDADWWKASSLADIFSRLPEAVFFKFPSLWAIAIWQRSAADVVGTLHASQRLLERLADDAPLGLRLNLMSAVIQLLMNRGQLVDAQDLTDQFAAHPAFTGNPLAAVHRLYFTRAIELYRGDPVDIVAYERDLDDFFATSAVQQSFRDLMVIGPYHRTHGDEAAERAAIARGAAAARSTQSPFIVGFCGVYGAISSWFWGDDASFAAYVAELEAAITPSIAGPFTHFIECVRGRPFSAKNVSEKLDMRAYAYAIAASFERRPRERLQLAEAALLAAQQSSQRLCEVISRVVLAMCDPRRALQHLDRCDELADLMQSTALKTAIAAVRDGDATGTMLGPLAGRFRSAPAIEKRPRWILDLENACIQAGEHRTNLTPRECILLAQLAARPGATRTADLVAVLWPNVPEERRRSNLRVMVNRLRKRLTDPSIIVATAAGYSLGANVEVTRTADSGRPSA